MNHCCACSCASVSQDHPRTEWVCQRLCSRCIWLDFAIRNCTFEDFMENEWKCGCLKPLSITAIEYFILIPEGVTSNPVHTPELETRAWLHLVSVSSIWNPHYCSKIYLKPSKSSCKRAKLWESDKKQCRVPHPVQIIPTASPVLGSDGDALEMRVVLSAVGVHCYCLFLIYTAIVSWSFWCQQLAHSPGNPLPCVSLGALAPHWPSYIPPALSRSQALSSRMLSVHFRLHSHFQIKRERKITYFQSRSENPRETLWSTAAALCPPAPQPRAPPLPCSPASSSTRSARQPPNSLYLGTVLTLVVLPAVVGHLVTYQVGLPVKSFGALVTLVLPLLTVRQHVLLQAVETGTGLSEMWVYRKRREQST